MIALFRIVVAFVLVFGGLLEGERIGGGFIARWYAGVTTDYAVVDRVGNSIPGLSPLVVNEGPVSCNDNHPVDGNGRAYFVSPASDDQGPYSPDGYVDCNECDCESNPGTNYNCRASDGRCIACNACTDSSTNGNAACGSRSDGNTRCEHVTCSTFSCVCDTLACAARTTDWGSCSYSGSAQCGPVIGSQSRMVYSCSGSSCVSSFESRSCSASAGSCPSGLTCVNNMCESSDPELIGYIRGQRPSQGWSSSSLACTAAMGWVLWGVPSGDGTYGDCYVDPLRPGSLCKDRILRVSPGDLIGRVILGYEAEGTVGLCPDGYADWHGYHQMYLSRNYHVYSDYQKTYTGPGGMTVAPSCRHEDDCWPDPDPDDPVTNTCKCEQEQYGTSQWIVVDDDCYDDRTAICDMLGGCVCRD